MGISPTQALISLSNFCFFICSYRGGVGVKLSPEHCQGLVFGGECKFKMQRLLYFCLVSTFHLQLRASFNAVQHFVHDGLVSLPFPIYVYILQQMPFLCFLTGLSPKHLEDS